MVASSHIVKARTSCLQFRNVGSATSPIGLKAFPAGLQKLHVKGSFITHQAMAGIAQCTRLTDLYIEETYKWEARTSGNDHNARLSGFLSCMCHAWACIQL